MRRVRGLLWAEQVSCPWPKSRARGSKALGLRYERLVASKIPGAIHNPWFKFQDAIGEGHCSPDVLVPGPPGLLVECKLKDWREAWEQVEGLYWPILEKVLGQRPVAVVVVRYASLGAPIVTTLQQAIAKAAERPVLHWPGHGPFPFQ